MPQITTFADLMTAHSSHKIFLVEIQPRQHLKTWTNYNGDVYYAEIEKVHVLTVEQNGSEMTEVDTLAEVAAGKWYYENGRIYLEVSSGSVYSKDIVAQYKLYFADEGVVFNNRFYDPFLATIPSIRQEKSDLFWGVSVISKGHLRLHNHNGFFDELYENYAWINQTVQILLGGESLPYSEYASMFKGKITQKKYMTREVQLIFTDDKEELEETLPISTFSVSTYPNIETEKTGQPIPYAWGTVRQMPVTCVNGALDATSTSLYSFKMVDTSTHSIQEITQVYVDGVKAVHQSASLAAATFKLGTSTFAVGQEVTADFKGYQSGTVLIENPIDVAKEIITLLGIPYNSSNYDTGTVSVARTDAENFPIGLVIKEYSSGLSELGKIMKSCLGTLIINNSGKFSITIWNTDLDTDLTELSEQDIVVGSLKVDAKYEDIRKTIRCGWRKKWATGTYAYEQQSTTITERLHGITRTRTIGTLLSSEAGAQQFLGKVGLMMENATIRITASSKIQLADKNVGDRIKMSFKRRDDDEAFGWLNEQPVEILKINKQYGKGKTLLVVDNLRGIGQGIGHWTDDLPAFPSYLDGTGESWDASWGAAKAQYAQQNWGYWTDANGFADPVDSRTKEISRWW